MFSLTDEDNKMKHLLVMIVALTLTGCAQGDIFYDNTPPRSGLKAEAGGLIVYYPHGVRYGSKVNNAQKLVDNGRGDWDRQFSSERRNPRVPATSNQKISCEVQVEFLKEAHDQMAYRMRDWKAVGKFNSAKALEACKKAQ